MELMKQITSCAVNIFSKDSLTKKIESKQPLKIKMGADPSRPDLHLGHTVILRQLKKFQELGHEIIFVIGDFTGMIGDPTGKSKTRTKLTMEQTRKSGQTYFEQVTKILDKTKTRIEYNSKWLNELSFADVIELTSKYTLARILERDDFSKRFKENQPLGIHELLYPLIQGYDSVALKTDIEVGGTDQTFNMLVGRELQRDYGQKVQDVITFPLLIGLDGKEKMSKSLDNYIGIDESPEIIFEKSMKIPDNILLDYFRLTTDIPVEDAKKLIDEDIVNAHMEYGKEIIRLYHGEVFIDNAIKRYKDIALGVIPKQMDEVSISESDLKDGIIGLYDLIRISGLANSNSEARRLVEGKGIKINNEVMQDAFKDIKCFDGMVISRGKSKYLKINIKADIG